MNRSLSLSNIDNNSQRSRRSLGGGNGNPMGLPGIPRDGVGIRQPGPNAPGLDKT